MKKLLLSILFILLTLCIVYKITIWVLYPTSSYAGARLAKWGVEYIINFELFEVDGVDFRIDASDTGTDSYVRKDQGAVATATNDFADEGNTYSLTITAGEMEAQEVMAQFIDQTATKRWLDVAYLIQTYGSGTAQHAFDFGTATQDINVVTWLDTAVTVGNSAPDVNIASTDDIDLSATQKASVNTEVDNALDTVLPTDPTEASINYVMNLQEEGIVFGTATAGTLSTTTMTTNLTIITVDDQFNGRIITFLKDTATANLRGQQTDITDTATADNSLTYTAITDAPSAGDVFEIN